MSTQFHCDDTETLVAYLYDDIDPVRRETVARHLPGCARCRDEVAALGGVRHALSEWTPPSPALRFTVVPESAVSNGMTPPGPAWPPPRSACGAGGPPPSRRGGTSSSCPNGSPPVSF